MSHFLLYCLALAVFSKQLGANKILLGITSITPQKTSPTRKRILEQLPRDTGNPIATAIIPSEGLGPSIQRQPVYHLQELLRYTTMDSDDAHLSLQRLKQRLVEVTLEWYKLKNAAQDLELARLKANDRFELEPP